MEEIRPRHLSPSDFSAYLSRTNTPWALNIIYITILAVLAFFFVPWERLTSEAQIVEFRSSLTAAQVRIASLEAALQSRPTPTTAPSVTPVPSAPNLSPADRGTNLEIWNRVNEDCHTDFANTINNLYLLLHDWPRKISENRTAFLGNLSDVEQQLNVASTCLEKLREEYPGYKDISQILMQPYTSLTQNAIEKFARAIKDLPQALPTDFQVGLRPDAGELQIELTNLQNWDGDVSRIANLKINELSGRR